MTPNAPPVRWRYRGKPDFLLGTGAAPAERRLAALAALGGAALYGFFFLRRAFPWAGWQYLLAAVLAYDVLGGVVANTLNSCKRFYHTPPRPEEPRYAAFFKNHLAFTALHVHPLLAAALYGGSLARGAFWYLFLLAAALFILRAPLYLQRPLAFFFITLTLLLNAYALPPLAGFEWLAPALNIKILYGHLVREEPYRPEKEPEA